MSRRTVALLAAGLLGLAGAAWAHDSGHNGSHGRGGRMSQEDRMAFQDARIAALHAGLKLDAEQDKLWPPVEAAMRGMAKMRQQRRESLRDRPSFESDAPGALRAMADAASARADSLHKLADAIQPLYASLSEDQKRRAVILSRPMGMRGGGPRDPRRRGGEDDRREDDH